MTLDTPIDQTNNPYTQTSLQIQLTASWLDNYITTVLRPFRLTAPQYHVLRVLNDCQRNEAATIKYLTDRMVDKASNASRLVDKLVTKGLVRRSDVEHDRRKKEVFITDEGSKIITTANLHLEKAIGEIMQKITPEEMTLLHDLLAKLGR